MPKRISSEVKARIKELLLQDRCGWEIAYDLGVSTTTVSKIRKELMCEGRTMGHTYDYLDSHVDANGKWHK